MSKFKIIAKDGEARAGILKTAHGEIKTPVFMPVGTQASVKALSPDDLKEAQAQVILGNTYHLYLRPGSKLIEKMGGLHKFMGWGGPILTDSGGFQAFSLGAMIEHGVKKMQNANVKSQNYSLKFKTSRGEGRGGGRNYRTGDIVSDSLKKPESREKKGGNFGKGEGVALSKITDSGIEFSSHLDGSRHVLTPEKSIQVQLELGSDIILGLDELLSPLHNKDYVEKSLERTHRWAVESKAHFQKNVGKSINPRSLLFGILQGVYDRAIREKEAGWIVKQGFDGISIGGSFGTSEIWGGPSAPPPAGGSLRMNSSEDGFSWAAEKAINQTFEWVTPLLPEDLPRHGLGIGEVVNLFDSIERGIDMFDCVSPTRRARNGSLYVSPKSGVYPDAPDYVTKKFTISIGQQRFAQDKSPIDPACICYACQNFSRAYLRHLYISSELLYHRLASIHNVYFICNLVGEMRNAILDKRLLQFRKKWTDGK